MHRCLRRAAVVLGLTLAFSPPAVAEPGCIADWNAARLIVQREKLVDVPAVKDGFAKQNPAKILEIVLCEEKGRYIYRLKILEPAGRVRFLSLDARKPL